MKDLIGKTISHYHILEKLGEGGMGVVYKAEDTRLKRPVALKFLPAHLTRDKEANQRFIHEAQAASALDHPNVCTIFQVDETADGHLFIAMGYYQGETLRQKIRNRPLPVETALDIAIQIAGGLAQAHEKGIVHRDVNPSNIIIQENSTVKIIDFGLTKLLSGERMTETGTVKGTVNYMSPEQARGAAVDHRTDIWALGVVLYEMLTGEKPFAAEFDQATIFLILNHPPAAPQGANSAIPDDLEKIILKALEKQLEDRYQAVFDMLTDLQALKDSAKPLNLAHPATTRKPARKWPFLNFKRNIIFGFLALLFISAAVLVTRYINSSNRTVSIMVLPLANHSGDSTQVYIADGMTDGLINDLAKIRSLRVISRTSAMQYKDTDKTIPEIAEELRVDILVEGSVRWMAGDRLQMTIQVVDGPSDRNLWAESYNRDLSDVLNLQHEITRTISRETGISLTPEESRHLSFAQSVDPEAYRLLLQGKYFADGLNLNPYRAIEFFEKAIKVDTNYALAYAELAVIYTVYYIEEDFSRDETYQKGIAAAQKALELDSLSAVAHAAIAMLKLWHDWDWTGAEKEFKRAINLDPGGTDGYRGYISFLVAVGREKEGLEVIQKVLDHDPVSPRTNMHAGWTYLHFEKYEQAIKQLTYTAEMSPTASWPHTQLAWAYAAKGDHEKALEECKWLEEHYPKRSHYTIGWIYAFAGQTEKALNMLRNLEENYQSNPGYAYQIAKIYAALGNHDKAFEWLEIAYQQRLLNFVLFKSVSKPNHPPLGFLRSDPRYWDLLKRLNFPEN